MSLLLALTAVAPPEPPAVTAGTRLGNNLFRWPDRRPTDFDLEFDLIVALVAADAI